MTRQTALCFRLVVEILLLIVSSLYPGRISLNEANLLGRKLETLKEEISGELGPPPV